MTFSSSKTVSEHPIEYLVHKSFFLDLSAPLHTSPHLYFILLYSKFFIILLQNPVPDHHTTTCYQQQPVAYNSRTAQELSHNVKIIQNRQHLTKWLVHESRHIPTCQDFSKFDHIY